jgi:hypothetical protein
MSDKPLIERVDFDFEVKFCPVCGCDNLIRLSGFMWGRRIICRACLKTYEVTRYKGEEER